MTIRTVRLFLVLLQNTLRMKNRVAILLFASLSFFLNSCGETIQKQHSLKPIALKGEWLFEGPNTLQVENTVAADAIMQNVDLEGSPKSIKINKASIDVSQLDPSFIESATLQVSSKNLDMLTLGTVTDLASGENGITLAEETDVYPYLIDEEMYWVLDVNLLGDSDELSIPLKLELTIIQ